MLETQLENLTNEIKVLQQIMSRFAEPSLHGANGSNVKPSTLKIADVKYSKSDVEPIQNEALKKNKVHELNEYVMAHVRNNPTKNRPFVVSLLQKYGCKTLAQAYDAGKLDEVEVELRKEFELC